MIRIGSALIALLLMGGMLMMTIPAATQEEVPTDERGRAGYFSTGISYLTNAGDANYAAGMGFFNVGG